MYSSIFLVIFIQNFKKVENVRTSLLVKVDAENLERKHKFQEPSLSLNRTGSRSRPVPGISPFLLLLIYSPLILFPFSLYELHANLAVEQ